MNTLKEILKERGNRYGKFEDNARISQDFKRLLDSSLLSMGKKLPDIQYEALTVIMQKVSRLIVGDHLYSDNMRDIAGYATLVADDLNKEDIISKEGDVTYLDKQESCETEIMSCSMYSSILAKARQERSILRSELQSDGELYND
jgi:hypothetical protein